MESFYSSSGGVYDDHYTYQSFPSFESNETKQNTDLGGIGRPRYVEEDNYDLFTTMVIDDYFSYYNPDSTGYESDPTYNSRNHGSKFQKFGSPIAPNQENGTIRSQSYFRVGNHRPTISNFINSAYDDDSGSDIDYYNEMKAESKKNDTNSNRKTKKNSQRQITHSGNSDAYYKPYTSQTTDNYNYNNNDSSDQDNTRRRRRRRRRRKRENDSINQMEIDFRKLTEVPTMGQPYSNNQGTIKSDSEYTVDDAIIHAKRIYFGLFPDKSLEIQTILQNTTDESEIKQLLSIDLTGIINIAGTTNFEQRRYIRSNYQRLFEKSHIKQSSSNVNNGKNYNNNNHSNNNNNNNNNNCNNNNHNGGIKKDPLLLQHFSSKLNNDPSLKYLLCTLFAYKGEFDAHLVYSSLVRRKEMGKALDYDLLLEILCTRTNEELQVMMSPGWYLATPEKENVQQPSNFEEKEDASTTYHKQVQHSRPSHPFSFGRNRRQQNNNNTNSSKDNDKNKDNSNSHHQRLFDCVSYYSMKTTMGIFSHKGHFNEVLTNILKCKRPKNTIVNIDSVIEDINYLKYSIFLSKDLDKNEMKSLCLQLFVNRSWSHIGYIVKYFQISKKDIASVQNDKLTKNKSQYRKYNYDNHQRTHVTNAHSDKRNKNKRKTNKNAKYFEKICNKNQKKYINLLEAFTYCLEKNFMSISDTGKALTTICKFAFKPYHFWAIKIYNCMKNMHYAGRERTFKILARIVVTRCEIDLWNIIQVLENDSSLRLNNITFFEWIYLKTKQKDQFYGLLIQMICGRSLASIKQGNYRRIGKGRSRQLVAQRRRATAL